MKTIRVSETCVPNNDLSLVQHEIHWAVGQVFKALKPSRIQNNTFVFLTADNGYVFSLIVFPNCVCSWKHRG